VNIEPSKSINIMRSMLSGMTIEHNNITDIFRSKLGKHQNVPEN